MAAAVKVLILSQKLGQGQQKVNSTKRKQWEERFAAN